MASLDELKKERLAKLEGLQARGIVAYPADTHPTHSGADFLSQFDSLLEKKTSVTLAGRIMSKREFGALAFLKLFDGTTSAQLVFEEQHNKEAIDFLAAYLDTGDFVEVVGMPYITKKGEKSLLVDSVRLLTKSLLPLPDKWDGLTDVETKVRLRYLDILTSDELRDMLRKKALFWQTVRTFLNERGFLEVETPTLEVTTGGAEARPFKTHHNDFDIDVYLRICIGELWQKRLMAAGIPRTYEIGRAYRNEGSSPEHLQEFTNCEFYMGYADYREGMKLVREMYVTIAKEVFGKTRFEMRGFTFDLADEWVEIDYADEIKKQTGLDIWTCSDEEIRDKLEELHVKYDGENRERLTDTLWKYCRKHIAGPAFLINHPLIVAPLAKPNPDGRTAQVFQPILAGSEVGRGYSELNDPMIQKKNFEDQAKLLQGGDEEAMMNDVDFVEMLEHGMPPTCGFGFGERLFSFLFGLPIRETQTFPLVKPKE